MGIEGWQGQSACFHTSSLAALGAACPPCILYLRWRGRALPQAPPGEACSHGIQLVPQVGGTHLPQGTGRGPTLHQKEPGQLESPPFSRKGVQSEFTGRVSRGRPCSLWKSLTQSPKVCPPGEHAGDICVFIYLLRHQSVKREHTGVHMHSGTYMHVCAHTLGGHLSCTTLTTLDGVKGDTKELCRVDVICLPLGPPSHSLDLQGPSVLAGTSAGCPGQTPIAPGPAGKVAPPE